MAKRTKLGLLGFLLLFAVPCFAIDAIQTQSGDVFYGEAELQDASIVTLTHSNGWTEQFDAKAVSIFLDVQAPTPKKATREGNFEIINGTALKAPIDLDNFRKGMLVALNLNKWRVESEEPGVINVAYAKAQILIRLRICYGTAGYWYEYVESKGLQAMPSLDRIQHNYYQVIQQLERQLQVYY